MTNERVFESDNGKLICNIIFALAVCLFIVFKVRDISLPYFWDELGVYVPGALKMKDNGTIGLLPSSLEPLYSRGHPLLFVFSQAAWFDLIGDTPTAGHAFSILLAVATLIAFYWCMKDLFGQWVSLLASVLLILQPMFFAMSGVVLPEMMLTLFTIPALWAIIKNKWGTYALFASLAMMTKESAIIIPPLAVAVIFIESVTTRTVFSLQSFRRYFFGIIPLLVYILFLLIQKKQNGWYFFPEHMGYLRLNASLIQQGKLILKDIVWWQGKKLVCVGMIIAVGLVLLRRGQFKYRRSIFIFLFFTACCIAFADLNFYLTRYLLYALPFVMATGVYGVVTIAELIPVRAGSVALALVFAGVTSFYSMKAMETGEFKDAADMGYKHLVLTEKEVIAWTEQQPWRDSVIEANFPLFQAMQEMRNGYLSVKPFDISVNYARKASYGVWFHFKEDDPIVWDHRPYTIIKRWKMPYAYISAVKY